MTMQDVKLLIERYNNQLATEEELTLIEALIASGKIELDQLNDVKSGVKKIAQVPVPELSHAADAAFYNVLASEMQHSVQPANTLINFIQKWFHQPQLNWAYSVALLLFGSAIGYFGLHSLIKGDEIAQLSADVSAMKQTMLVSMLDQESSTTRLKAVSMSNNLEQVDEVVATALINSLRTDPSTNVRLASVEALSRYTANPNIRTELISSIGYQESPLVQLAMAELMVAMQEKEAVDAFDEIIARETTPPEIKKELKDQMDKLVYL